MSSCRSLPIDDLIKTSEETVALMWRTYDVHMGGDRNAPRWHQTAEELYRRCTKFEERLQTLKQIRHRTTAPRANTEGKANGARGEDEV